MPREKTEEKKTPRSSKPKGSLDKKAGKQPEVKIAPDVAVPAVVPSVLRASVAKVDPLEGARMPVVAIVGRPNVGKSSLLNALAGRLISIVQDMPGVTRDRISYPLSIGRRNDGDEDFRFVELLDTGGYGFTDPTGLTEHIRHQIDLAIARADLVLFIVDTQAGLTSGDEEIVQLLRTKGLKVSLIANKADGERADLALSDFARLGFGTPVGVSALNHRNLDGVFAAIRKNIDLSKAPKQVPAPEMMVAIVGKRNAGKSTLVNSIARIYENDGEDPEMTPEEQAAGGRATDRVIVSEVPGTTRDSVDVRFEKHGQTLVVIDTAGVRKKRQMVSNDIEFYSFHRAERSIRRADVVLLLIDATEPVSEPDKKLAAYISQQFKPVVLVVNKWDLAREQFVKQAHDAGQNPDDRAVMVEYREYLDKTLRHVDYAPIAFITAKEGKNVEQVLNLARHLHKQASERIGTGRLNSAIEQIFDERTPTHRTGKRPRVYYGTQTSTNPPEIVLFVNNPTLIDVTYQRFMINRFRELLPYAEVPIKLIIRGKTGAAWSGKNFEKGGSPPDKQPGVSRPVWDGSETGRRPTVGGTLSQNKGRRPKFKPGAQVPDAVGQEIKAPKPGKSLPRAEPPGRPSRGKGGPRKSNRPKGPGSIRRRG